MWCFFTSYFSDIIKIVSMAKKKKKKQRKKKDIVFVMQYGAFFVCALSIFLLHRVLFHSFDIGKIFVEKDIPSVAQLTGVQSMENEVRDEGVRCEFTHFATGVCVDSQEQVSDGLVAVIIENHKDAQPLSGITKADIVYEAPAEGGIPRFLALFRSGLEVDKVGPIRSARPYFLDWLAEYGDPLFFHVGGSPKALERIVQEGVRDMDEFSRGWYFWRSRDRYAPHNTYTSSKLWSKAKERYGNGKVSQESKWDFKPVSVCEEGCVTMIDIDYFYKHQWWYKAESNMYVRRQFRRPHTDLLGEQIVASTVVIQYVDVDVIDNVGRLRLGTLGTGRALVFQGGHVFEGVWKKDSYQEQTQWLETNGNTIPINPGHVWVEIIPNHAGEVRFE